MIENIIFDFDGVLVDSEILAGRAFVKYLKSHNMLFSEQEFATHHAGDEEAPLEWEGNGRVASAKGRRRRLVRG